jgi:hypothetical protein
LSAVAGISLVYDLTIGVLLLVATGSVASWFHIALPSPILFVKLNALFLICVGLGYLQPLRYPQAHRTYLWVFGPLLKGGGAIVFLWDHLANGAPASVMLFAVSDGTLALVTLAALISRRPGGSGSGGRS